MPRKAKDTGTRRGNKEGSIYQRKDGLWCGQVLMGYRPNGRPDRKTFYGKTRAEVSEKVTKAAANVFTNPAAIHAHNLTVEQYLDEWLFQYKKREVSARTLEWYVNIAKTSIKPYVGKIPLKKLAARDVQKMLNKRLDEGLSPSSVKAARDVLNQAMKHAIEMQLIVTNPVQGAKLPKHDRKIQTEKQKAIPVEVRKRLLEAAAQSKVMKPIIFTILFVGLRIGELLGLIWRHVDLENGVLFIDRAVTLDPQFDEEGKRVSRKSIIATTKTPTGIRKIRIPALVVDALREWRERQEVKNPMLVADDAYVFADRFGKMRAYNSFRGTYRNFLKAAGLEGEHLNLHRYRHTFATMMLENGVNPRVAQKLLGHKDIETTLGTYSHVLSEVFDEVADTLDDVYKETCEGTYRPGAENKKKDSA